jgi:hypothetical protein
MAFLRQLAARLLDYRAFRDEHARVAELRADEVADRRRDLVNMCFKCEVAVSKKRRRIGWKMRHRDKTTERKWNPAGRRLTSAVRWRESCRWRGRAEAATQGPFAAGLATRA